MYKLHVKQKEIKMDTELSKWEYRVQTVGGFFTGVQAEELQELLNGWGEEGWEVILIHILDGNTSKVNVVAKRLLTRETIRRRSMIQSD